MKRILPLIAVVFVASFLHGQTNDPQTAGRAESTQIAVEQELQALEQTWADAVKHQDAGKIDRIQAEEYVFTDPAGQLWTKARELETVKSGGLTIDSFELSDVKVRLYDNTAVVTLRVVWNGQSNGVDISGPQRMTDVFVKRDGRWQCVASQTTRIPPQPAGNVK
jgi:ketosteroid isomerase-like protein